MPRERQSLLAVAALLGLTHGTRAYAQSHAEDETTWRALVASAVTARTTGDHARALELAGRALQTHATPSLQRFVAEEQSALGHVVEALASAQRCIDGATADPNLPERAATLSVCTVLARQLDARVGRLVIQAPDPVPTNLHVTVAGSPLSAALLGVPYVVSPGVVIVVAQAPERQSFRGEVTVGAGATVPLTLAMPPIVRRVQPLAVHPEEPTTLSPSPAPVRTSSSVHRTLAIGTTIGAGVMAGVGIVAVAVGTSAANSFNNANPLCMQQGGHVYGPGTCTQYASTANGMAALAIGGFTVSGVLAVASVVLWLTVPRHDATPPVTSFGCGVGPGTLGIACGTAF